MLAYRHFNRPADQCHENVNPAATDAGRCDSCRKYFGNWVMSFTAPRMDRIKPSPSSMATMRARGLQGAVYGTSPYLRLSYSSSTEKLQ